MKFTYKILKSIICIYFTLERFHVKGSINFDTRVKLFVEGSGFHRNIIYKIKTNFNSPKCYVALYMKLPSSLYVNVDELVELRKRQKSLICSNGEKDVESFTENALPQNISVCSTLNDDIILSIPVHQRYQFATTEGGYKNITFPNIELLLGCHDIVANLKVSKIELCLLCKKLVNTWYSLPFEFENKTYVWQVPVGQITHLKFVTVITLLSTIIGSIFILKTLWRIEFSHCKEN